MSFIDTEIQNFITNALKGNKELPVVVKELEDGIAVAQGLLKELQPADITAFLTLANSSVNNRFTAAQLASAAAVLETTLPAALAQAEASLQSVSKLLGG